MKTFSMRFRSKDGEHSWTDWIPEDQIENTKCEAAEHGCTATVVGEVSWRTQLAAMENPEL